MSSCSDVHGQLGGILFCSALLYEHHPCHPNQLSTESLASARQNLSKGRPSEQEQLAIQCPKDRPFHDYRQPIQGPI